VRLIPISENFLENVETLAGELEKHCVRVDIDDRPLTLQKRIREAETEWVPYTVVVGQKELDSNELPVRDRSSGEMRKMKLEELVKEIQRIANGKPFKPLPLPKHLSRRPQFHG
jgi:threonyl-tRNA synthetase